MRESIVRQYASPCEAEHVYLQKPSTHFCGAPVVLHIASDVQFGVGRVSTTHAPWSQNLPAPQVPSVVQLATHAPDTHFGAAGSVQLASPVQPPPPEPFGSQTPFVHVKPSPHEALSQPARHWPSAQIFPCAHSLENLQVFVGEVHAPATHVRPPVQSVVALHGQGPALPPHAWQTLFTQTLLPSELQSVFVVHSFVPPGVVPGAVHVPDLQTVPFGHDASLAHCCAQPFVVQTDPLGQLELPVHDCVVGAGTFEHP